MKGGECMSIWGNLLSFVLTSSLNKRKESLEVELQKQIETTDSDWVKIRNQGWLALLDNAGPFVISEIEKKLNK